MFAVTDCSAYFSRVFLLISRHYFMGRAIGLAFVWLLAFFLVGSPAQANSFEAGLSAYQKKDYAVAIPLLQRALAEQSTDNVNIRYYLADAYLKNNQLGEAQAQYNQILATAPGTQAARLSAEALANLKRYAFETPGRLTASVTSINTAITGAEDKLLGISAGKDDYLADVTNAGRYVRWSLLKLPVKIYVEKNPTTVSHFEPGFAATIAQAMAIWSKALGGQLRYMMVNTPQQADVQVYWVNGIDKHGFNKDNVITFTAGLTTPQIESEQLRLMKIQVATRDIQGKPQAQSGIFATVLHEMGHALGLLGHSDQPGDLMFIQDIAKAELSARDTNTIRKLYLMTPDVSNLPLDPALKNDTQRAERVNEAVDKAIIQYEAQAKVLGNSLNWTNLGVNYMKKAEIIKGKKPEAALQGVKSQPVYWRQKAVDAFSRALESEPQNVLVLSRRATAFQSLGQQDKALVDISLAIKQTPRDPDLYLQQAQVFIALGQKPQALNALNAFKNLAPGAVQSAAYKAVAAKLQ